MTIIQPNNLKLNLPLMLLTGILVIMAVFSIYFYNQNVDIRHEISRVSKDLQDQQTLNADYKNQYYQTLNAKNAEILAKQQGLVPEKNPVYLESQQKILASN